MEICIEKGKGHILGKLRNLQLIKEDLQIMMRMFLSSDREEIIENDNRFLKANFGSRHNYSIKTAILEKWLIFYHSMLTTKKTIYNLTDLKSCYD